MVDADRSEFWHCSHRPHEAAHRIAIAIVPPIPAGPAAVDFAIGCRKVSGVIPGAERFFTALAVPSLLAIQGIDGGPARRVADLSRSGTAIVAVGPLLFVDAPRPEKWSPAEFLANPVEHVSHMRDPFGVYFARIRAGQDVVRGHGWQILIDVEGIFIDVLKVAAPTVVGSAPLLQRKIANPFPGHVPGFLVRGS